ncbi:hypothetical protein [Streptomyces sp. PTD5-9]|uniref:hypothetical protein n=1 Tax=Streptomyces sp. PTD5-9 TaxID=3120150 RepID=UPI00300B94D5
MPQDPLTWAVTHPWPATGITALAVAAAITAIWLTARAVRQVARAICKLTFPPGSVVVAGLSAAVCTAYSADTSWMFAEHHLGMTDTTERIVMFAAGELALLACAVMARATKAATATGGAAGTAGVPGVLVWCITGVQIVPAYSESGLLGGTVRACFGPVAAGLLWHLAMGLEIRVARPGALSTGLPAVIGRELRERLLSRLGLTARDRTADQISRDRATARAVRLAALLELRPGGLLAPYRRRRLAAAVARSGAGTDGEQRHRLLQQLAARRTSGQLATIVLDSPWAGTPVPGTPYPQTPLGVTGAVLRRLDPLTTVRQVRAAHPDVTPAELAALCTGYGVPVSETQARVAIGAGNPAPPASEVPVPGRPAPGAAPKEPAPVHEQAPAADPGNPAQVHPEVPVPAAAGTRTRSIAHAEVPLPDEQQVPVPEVPDEEVPEGDRDVPDPDPLIARARTEYGTQVPGVRALKAGYGIGQARAQRIRDALTPAAVRP